MRARPFNFEAETKAARIRVRAERKAGRLLKEMPNAPGARGNPGGTLPLPAL